MIIMLQINTNNERPNQFSNSRKDIHFSTELDNISNDKGTVVKYSSLSSFNKNFTEKINSLKVKVYNNQDNNNSK
jgi:hypothetical protein